MSIKYHQYGVGNDYGSDHKLTDNWNPDLDYGNEYVKVYFNIKTPSYDGNSFASTEDREKWHEETSSLISSFGIMEDSGYKVETGKEKCAYLYAHPQQISGVVRKNDVRKIAETLNDMKMSSLRSVELYATVYNISDEEYDTYLEGKKKEIRKAIFEKAATTRKTSYYAAIEVAKLVSGMVRLNRLGVDDGKHFGRGQTIDYILKMADEMAEEGLLKTCERDGTKYIRSLNKTEQKQKKEELAWLTLA